MPDDLIIYTRMPEIAGLRDIRGQFTSALTEQRLRNQRIAIQVQGSVVQYQKNRISFGKRASASTGRLVHATADRNNIYYDQWGFGVGRPDYLNRSVAKYWRTFEEGSLGLWKHPFIGTQLLQITKNKGRTPSARYTDLRTVTAKSKFTGYDGDRFVVKKEIEPAYAYRNAWQNAHLGDTGVENVLKMLNRVFERGIHPGGGFFG